MDVIARQNAAQDVDCVLPTDLTAEATTLIRSLLEEIRLIPNAEGPMDIELVGELAGLLALGQTKSASKGYASGRSVSLVAGVGFEPTTFRL
ncbi:hypothetical protein J7413_08870 [Shimia sp. R10_1]|uniref:hypothetical protein n=1 Tax=Shimia sp. R10_1 TaxID=2821095 RepID=UPI001ADAC0EA|nr:hypothetical protein [Shimia sp. R10_1]MBO9473648.1 hypothetical protein [Shimia sp. R10_1]